MKSFVVLCERTCLRGSWFPFFFLFFVWCSLFPLDIWRFDRELFFRVRRSFWVVFRFTHTQFTWMLHTEILSFSGSLKLRFSFTRKTQDFSVQHPGSLSISFTGKKLKDLLTRKKFPVSPPNVHQEKFTSKKKKKKNGKQLPRRLVLTHAPRKAFHYPERDKNRPFLGCPLFHSS